MNLFEISGQMAHNARTIQHLATGFTAAQARQKPGPGAWSAVEVLNHLYAEERGDFRVYLAEHLDAPAPPRHDFDVQSPYDADDLAAATQAFMEEREASLAWLRALKQPQWDTTFTIHGRPITTGDMLASWAAHDVLHIRQLVELQFMATQHLVRPHRVGYAGEW